jgi:hypothetical protein
MPISVEELIERLQEFSSNAEVSFDGDGIYVTLLGGEKYCIADEDGVYA